MQKELKIIKLTASLLLLLMTTGCWNSRELKDLAIVLGVGLDKPRQSAKNILVTAQIFRPASIQSPGAQGSGGSGGVQDYENIQNTGSTLFDTLRGFTHKLSSKPYFPHIEVLIFGRALAEEGLQKYIDFFVRDPETRLGVKVLIAQNKAGDIFKETPFLGTIPAEDIEKIIKAQEATSKTCTVNLEQFITRLMSKTTSPIAPLVELTGEGEKKRVRVAGTAVFKKDKLAGQLDGTETRGLLWVIDEIKSGIITVKCPDEKSTAELEIIRAQSKITPEIDGDNIRFRVSIKEEGNIGTESGSDNLVLLPAIEALEKAEAAVIQSEVMAAVTKAQKLDTDIFGFGEIIHQRSPALWKDLENKWDDIFPNIEVEVSVQAKLRRSGRIGPPVSPPKE
ncbi:germination protein, Ger(X)C family [Desulfosporosinus acidiphilus SJ4]|uniref:Germination protein, Ger(X)C family n=1 Tax=Desulfosporosinus acidiphilus (strain DSM 22704 / JCM 16185 / SJ4) TaxID=646529 RepID=I4DB42_DESAJ|nr:Ger(x)C family spore germination protein [Desulfosporosinus acidiphilus]AFM43016.1 germination protein, Ger(X)C family [Desulfosporosinus acidiphilus SJ4]